MAARVVGCFFVSCLLGARGAEAKVAPVSLEELTWRASLVAVARVERILSSGPRGDAELPEVRLAEARILESVSGEPGAGTVLFLASPTWTCDTTSADVGETVLVFLRRASPPAWNEPWLAPAEQLAGGRPVFVIDGSGRGRMKVVELDGTKSVEVSSDVRLPAYIPTQRGEDPRSSLRLAPLRLVIEVIREVAATPSTGAAVP